MDAQHRMWSPHQGPGPVRVQECPSPALLPVRGLLGGGLQDFLARTEMSVLDLPHLADPTDLPHDSVPPCNAWGSMLRYFIS